nr:hypothetical protein [Nanoarchaeum sp.]
MRKLEILIVEDTPKHLEDVKTEVARLKEKGQEINVAYATNYTTARELIASREFDGIVSDVFIPESEGKVSSPETIQRCKEVLPSRYFEEPRNYDLFWRGVEIDYKRNPTPYEQGAMQEFFQYNAIEKWTNGEAQAPLGTLVAEDAKAKRVPLVFCSATYHHGHKAQPVCTYAITNQIPFIDSGSGYFEDKDRKNWEKALQNVIDNCKTD